MNSGLFIVLFTPVIFGLLWFEHRHLLKKYGKGYSSYFFFQNIQQAQGQQVFNIGLKVLLIPFMYYIHENYRLFDFEVGFVSVLVSFLLFDLLQYCLHRMSHRYHFLWAFHVVHHSANDFNLSVSLRNPWFFQIFGALYPLTIVFIGVDPLLTISVITLGNLVAFWLHIKDLKPLPLIEKVINTPSLHKVHHSKASAHVDKNFGHLLSIWDHMFGTHKTEEEECEFGIMSKTEISNPLWQNTYYFFFIAALIKRAPTLIDKIKLPFSSIAKVPYWMTPKEYDDLHQAIANKTPGRDVLTSSKKKLWASFCFVEGTILMFILAENSLDTQSKIAFSLVFFGILYAFGQILNNFRGLKS